MPEHCIIGKSILKKDGWSKVSGQAKFTDDISLPGMLYAKVLRSTVPHATVKGIDFAGALGLPGVVSVLTWKDVPGRNRVGIIIKDEPVLVEDKIRRIGDAVAVIAAEKQDIAEAALQKVSVNLEELSGLFTTGEAMADGAPLIHDRSGNIMAHRKVRKGDLDQALKSADLVIENTYRTPYVEHASLEPESSIALREGDSMTVWTSTQNPHFDRDEVAAVLGIEQNKVRVVQQHTGGGFGGKLDISTQCHAALLSWHTRRPVKLTYTREESFFVSSKRHPSTIKYLSAVSKTGKLLGVRVNVIADTGAYASYGPGVINRMAFHATGPYEVDNVHVDAYGVYTNNPYCGAMRGFGVPQLSFVHESQMDLLAEALGMDSWEIRRINLLRIHSSTATRQVLKNSVGMEETLNTVEAEAKKRM